MQRFTTTPQRTRVTSINKVFFISTFSPERPGKIAEKCDLFWDRKKPTDGGDGSVEDSSKKPKGAEELPEFNNLNNSVFVFVK